MIKAILVSSFKQVQNMYMKGKKGGLVDLDSLVLFLDIAKASDPDRSYTKMIMNTCAYDHKSETTIEDTLGNLATDAQTGEGNHVIPGSIIEACFRMAIATCFLGSGSHKILEPDVLDKHLELFRQLHPDDPKRKEMIAEAKSKGRGGWSIGRGLNDRDLKLPVGVSYAEAMRSEGSGKSLLYCHTRAEHWRFQRYGTDLQNVKFIRIHETIVRPDLPPKPILP